MFTTCRPDRLLEARALAVRAGALTTAAVLEVQVAGCLALALDTEARSPWSTRPSSARSGPAPAPSRLRLWLPRPWRIASLAGRSRPARAADRAVQLSGDDPETRVLLTGLADGMGGLLQEDRGRARRGFAEMARHGRRAPDAPPLPSYGLHALLATIEGEPGAAQVREGDRRSGATTAPYNALLLAYADAVAAGSSGRPHDAERLLVAAEQALPGNATGRTVGVLQHLGRRLVAERAILDGWGEPAAWLRAPAATFDITAPQVAAACRRLLRAAGERAPTPCGPAAPGGSPAGRRHGARARSAAAGRRRGPRTPRLRSSCTCRHAPSRRTSPACCRRPASPGGDCWHRGSSRRSAARTSVARRPKVRSRYGRLGRATGRGCVLHRRGRCRRGRR